MVFRGSDYRASKTPRPAPTETHAGVRWLLAGSGRPAPSDQPALILRFEILVLPFGPQRGNGSSHSMHTS